MQESDFLRKTISSWYSGEASSVYSSWMLTWSESLSEDTHFLEEDVWGAAGPIIGLANSLGAIYRAGAQDAILYLKSLIISWIPNADNLFQKSSVGKTRLPMFAIRACLALPTVVSFCHRVELIDDTELGYLVSSFMELIYELLHIEQSATFHQNLLMASCVEAGSLLSIIMNSRLHSLEAGQLKSLLELCRRQWLADAAEICVLQDLRILGLLSATERIHDWVGHVEGSAYLSGPQPIDKSEKEAAVMLLQAMHQTRASLKEHLLVDKLLKLANMAVP